MTIPLGGGTAFLLFLLCCFFFNFSASNSDFASRSGIVEVEVDSESSLQMSTTWRFWDGTLGKCQTKRHSSLPKCFCNYRTIKTDNQIIGKDMRNVGGIELDVP